MWKILGAMLLAAAPALAQQNATAYEALRTVGQQLNRNYLNHIISVTGSEGDPQPETWKILIDDSRARGGVREVEIRNGKIVSERTPTRSVVGSSEGATINTTRLNLDSSGAFTVASHTADKSHRRFATASYTLRTDERGNPIWIVTLHNERSTPVGTIHIGANKGNVTRTEGMFAGADMNDVVDDREQHDEERHTDQNDGSIRGRIRGMFQRAQEEARDVFDRSRRSFVDFINRI
jgi:hypothetical protein